MKNHTHEVQLLNATAASIHKQVNKTIEKLKQDLIKINDTSKILKQLKPFERYFIEFMSPNDKVICLLNKLNIAIPSDVEVTSKRQLKNTLRSFSLYNCTDSTIRNTEPNKPYLLAYRLLYDYMKSYKPDIENLIIKGVMRVNSKSQLNNFTEHVLDYLYQENDISLIVDAFAAFKEVDIKFKFIEGEQRINHNLYDLYILDHKSVKTIVNNHNKNVNNFISNMQTELYSAFPKLILDKL